MIELLDPQWQAEGLVGGMFGGADWTTVAYGNHIVPEVVPALVTLRERLTTAGYEFVAQPVHVIREERTAGGAAEAKITYQVSHWARFRQGAGVLIAEVEGSGDTLAEAVSTAQTKIGEIRYGQAPVASGRGQATTCREIARQLFAAHGAWLAPKGQVVVPYYTRGGRGGWMGKVARRRFDPADLQAPPAGGRYYCTSCGRPAPRTRQHYEWDEAARTYTYTSRCCNAPVRRGKP